MTKPLDLRRELPGHALELFPLVSGAFVYRDATPAHSFTTVLAPMDDTKSFLALTARDCFDELLAVNILGFVRTRWKLVFSERPISIIEGFRDAKYEFDSVAILNPCSANIYEHENQKLNSQTFVSFPIFRCEFSGQETCDLIDMIRHDFVSTLDWKRRASPQVHMRFRNSKIKSKSTGKKLGLTSDRFLFDQLHELACDNDSFIEVKNYKGDHCHIRRRVDGYDVRLWSSQSVVCMPAHQIDGWLSAFLTKGVSAQ